MIQVLYDISLLSEHDIPRYRTGIYRVVENVARGLAAASECDLTFCVGQHVDKSLAHVSNDRQLRNVPLALTTSFKIRRALRERIEGLTHGISASKTDRAVLHKRVARRVFYHAYNTVASNSGWVSRKLLEHTDIFHSPFHAIPEQTRSAARLKRFLTVYDLIAVQQPKLFEPPVESAIRRILESLREDDFALCISQSTKRDLCDFRPGLDPNRIFVTPLGASDQFHLCANQSQIEAVKKKYGIPPETQYVLSLATLEPRKNLDQAIRCFGRVVAQERLKDLRLVLVGARGWDYDHVLEAVSQTPSVSEYIIFTGYVPDEDLSPLYSGALTFIYLSLYEGFGLPPLEAMQCGTPVVTSNTSSLPEVVGDAGKMFAPEDADGICQALLDIYTRPDLRSAMSERSLARARMFSWDKCTRETIAAYQAALAN